VVARGRHDTPALDKLRPISFFNRIIYGIHILGYLFVYMTTLGRNSVASLVDAVPHRRYAASTSWLASTTRHPSSTAWIMSPTRRQPTPALAVHIDGLRQRRGSRPLSTIHQDSYTKSTKQLRLAFLFRLNTFYIFMYLRIYLPALVTNNGSGGLIADHDIDSSSPGGSPRRHPVSSASRGIFPRLCVLRRRA